MLSGIFICDWPFDISSFEIEADQYSDLNFLVIAARTCPKPPFHNEQFSVKIACKHQPFRGYFNPMATMMRFYGCTMVQVQKSETITYLFAPGLFAVFGELLPSFFRMNEYVVRASDSLFQSDANLAELCPIIIFNRFKRTEQ